MVGEVTVRLIVGFALLEEVALLETTPLASTPTTVNV